MVPWSHRRQSIKSAGLIVNATAGGMKGKPALDVSLLRSRPDALIYDLIYTPLETPLIKEAISLNRKYIGGLDMLIGQAKPSFELFYGQAPDPQYDPRPLLLKALGEK